MNTKLKVSLVLAAIGISSMTFGFIDIVPYMEFQEAKNNLSIEAQGENPHNLMPGLPLIISGFPLAVIGMVLFLENRNRS